MAAVSEALTKENKKLVGVLLATGRWGNKSEIVRYGLHLVKREVEAEQAREFKPEPAGKIRKPKKPAPASPPPTPGGK